MNFDNEYLSFTFITEKEKEEIVKFKDKHKKCKNTMSYIFTTGAIGRGLEIKCNGCCVIKDITDISHW